MLALAILGGPTYLVRAAYFSMDDLFVALASPFAHTTTLECYQVLFVATLLEVLKVRGAVLSRLCTLGTDPNLGVSLSHTLQPAIKAEAATSGNLLSLLLLQPVQAPLPWPTIIQRMRRLASNDALRAAVSAVLRAE
mgnify:CR=1 FL=1